MNTIINLVAKFSGAGKVWNMLDGKKSMIAAIVGMLSGLAGLTQEFLAVEGKHDFAALLAFAQGIPQDSNWLLIVGSMAVLGISHKLAKNTDAVVASAPVAAPPPAVAPATPAP